MSKEKYLSKFLKPKGGNFVLAGALGHFQSRDAFKPRISPDKGSIAETSEFLFPDAFRPITCERKC